MSKKIKLIPLVEATKTLIREQAIGTQEELVEKLAARGYEVNQSKISRLLRKLTVVKIQNEDGTTIYALPKEPAPPSTQSSVSHLIIDIIANENLVIIQTSPGSASLIARLLDYHQKDSTILATLAGDDTIFVAPKSIKHIRETIKEVKELLPPIGGNK